LFEDLFCKTGSGSTSWIGTAAGSGDDGTGGRRFTKGGGRCFILGLTRGFEMELKDVLWFGVAGITIDALWTGTPMVIV
jgi:hypothetical protein